MKFHVGDNQYLKLENTHTPEETVVMDFISVLFFLLLLLSHKG